MQKNLNSLVNNDYSVESEFDDDIDVTEEFNYSIQYRRKHIISVEEQEHLYGS